MAVSRKRMRFSDITNRLMPLLEDAQWAENFLENEDNQFTRRAYIRNVFAMIEGSIWIFKQIILYATVEEGKIKKIPLAEFVILSEKTYELTNDGKPKEQTKYLKLPANLRFTFDIMNRYSGANLELGIGTTSWENFLKAQQIRNRITHPKDSNDFLISDDEIAICQKVCSWYNEIMLDLLNALVISNSENNIDKTT